MGNKDRRKEKKKPKQPKDTSKPLMQANTAVLALPNNQAHPWSRSGKQLQCDGSWNQERLPFAWLSVPPLV